LQEEQSTSDQKPAFLRNQRWCSGVGRNLWHHTEMWPRSVCSVYCL